jgi:molybdate transport system regulatory protein
MQISARNQFTGTITGLRQGPVNAEVVLTLPGGDVLLAVVTRASVAAMGLALGGQATAVVKAPWVMLATGGNGLGVGASNHWPGVVSTLSLGPVNAQVALVLPGGNALQAVVTREAVAELGLAPGVQAWAIVKPSDVVLAADAPR